MSEQITQFEVIGKDFGQVQFKRLPNGLIEISVTEDLLAEGFEETNDSGDIIVQHMPMSSTEFTMAKAQSIYEQLGKLLN